MFILFFDSRYFRWAPLLIESIMINEPEERICVYGIGLKEFQVEKLLSYPQVIYVPTVLQETECISQKALHDKKAIRIVQKTAYYFLESFRRFPKEEPYMILDVDSLVNRDLTKIKRRMAKYDLGISLGKAKARTGFVLVNPTEVSKRFIEDWNALLMGGSCYWNKNQTTLFQLHQERKEEMRFLEFGVSYTDFLSKHDSRIWSAYKTRFGSKDERYLLYKKRVLGNWGE